MKTISAKIFIFITVLVDVIGIGIIIPVMPTLIKDLTGRDLSEASAYGGGLLIAFASMQFLFAPVLGELSDKFGRRPVLLLSLFGLSIDYLIHAFAPTILWLFIGRFLAGIGGASFTVANAYMADISSPSEKAKNFGLLGAAFGFGFIIGPSIGGIFGAIDVRLPFFIAAGLTFLNFLFGYFLVPESLAPEKRREIDVRKMIPGVSLAKVGKYAGLGSLIFAFFLANIAGQTLPAIWSFFTMEVYAWNEAEVGYSLTFIGILVAIVQGGLIGIFVKKFGEHKTVIFGFSLWTIGMFLFALASESWMMYLFLIPYALGGVAGPTLQGILSNQVPENEQGNLQGALTSMLSLTTIIGPAIATGLFYAFTGNHAITYFPGAPYIAGGLLLLSATVMVILSLRKRKDGVRLFLWYGSKE
ncbi:MAG: DHA1 family tetracycline resistance protein-like MFS transporter [Saprospiraceae bacterium]|jgi:DHA1 family tetracycline resistance protein-like MFS transporter